MKKPRWDRKPCGCVKTTLLHFGKATIRCAKHRDKPSKRTLFYFDADGIVRKEVA